MRLNVWTKFLMPGVLMLSALACSQVDFSKIEGPKCQGFDETCIRTNGIDSFDYRVIVDPPNYKTDILFVDDNSGSMAPEQSNMAFRFPTFLSSINSLDYRIGIVTTDMNGTGPLQDGNLLPFSTLSGVYYLTKLTPNMTTSFQDTIQIGETGFGDERGIYSAIKLIQKETTPGTSRGFLRDDANLAVIILSDEDERSNGGNTPPPYGGPLEAGRDNPSDLVNLVKNTWGSDKTLTVHTITIQPGDQTCYNQQKAQPGQTANFGVVYESLRQMTGGVKGTVCASDYGAQLTQIGNVQVAQISSLPLACSFCADTNQCRGVQGSLQVLDVNGSPIPGAQLATDKVVFTPPLVGGTEVRLIYQCRAQ